MTSETAPDHRIDLDRVPGHIAIIMDGNGRWAEARGKPRLQGHEAGARNLRDITEACRELGVKALTLFAFSTENWRRPKSEVDDLFRLFSKYMRRYSNQIHKTDVRLLHLGHLDGLPEQAAEDIRKCMEQTRHNSAMDVCVALNYGGRAEIIQATQRLAEAVERGEMKAADIDEDRFAQELYVPEHNEVDLLIRTSGEYRISNFLLWQISYSEIVVTPTLWPDFNRQSLYDAIVEYQSRKRRFGGRP